MNIYGTRFLFWAGLALLWLGPISPGWAHSGHKHAKDEPTITLPDVLAKVGDTNIPKEAIWQELKNTVALYNEKGVPLTPEQEKTAVKQLVDREIGQVLLGQKAKALGIAVTAEEIDGKFRVVRAKFASEEEFNKKLSARKLTPAKYREQLKNDITLDKILQREMESRLKVDAKEIEEHYNKNLSQFQNDEKFQVSVILIKSRDKTSDPDNRQARDKIGSLRDQIKNGADFSELAQRFSQDSLKNKGGDMGLVDAKLMLPLFRDVAAKLKVGGVSEPFQSDYGWHLLKLTAKEPAKTTTLDEARDTIAASLKEKKIQEQAKAYVESMRQAADVKTYF
jgi:peptidyl-prolyl cis-trans isomerase C